MNQDLLFSFIIPVYNASDFIESCVASVLRQESNQYEIILVDDGSKDDLGIVCDRLASEHPCIKVIHKENGGLSSARNAGVQAASGEYVFFLDADDTIRSTLLTDVMKIESLKSYDIIIGQVEMVRDMNQEYSDSKPFDYFTCSRDVILDLYTKEKIQGYAVCKFVRRSVILKNHIEFPVGHNYEDIRTVYKFLIHSDTIAVMNRNYYNYYIANQSSITNNDSLKNLNDYYASIELMYNDLKQNSDLPKLRCLRLNHLIQLYIRLFYYSKKDSQAVEILNKVKRILDTEKVTVKEMKGYCHYQKYFLYRIKLLDGLLNIKMMMKRDS